jgi:hypothetical protein
MTPRGRDDRLGREILGEMCRVLELSPRRLAFAETKFQNNLLEERTFRSGGKRTSGPGPIICERNQWRPEISNIGCKAKRRSLPEMGGDDVRKTGRI